MIPAHEIQEAATPLDRLPTSCDVLIAGAGPAGALLACELAAAGIHVVVAEKNSFPRHKICGCCLSYGALAVIEKSAARNALDGLPKIDLSELKCFIGNIELCLPIQKGRALSRANLDSALVLSAVEHGAVFSHEVSVSLCSLQSKHVEIELSDKSGQSHSLQAKVFVAADGLGGTSLSAFPRFGFTCEPAARIGIGCILPANNILELGSIHMYYHPFGYIGAVQAEDGLLNIAAAIDPPLLKQGVNQAVSEILNSHASASGLASALQNHQWKGTPMLSRYRKSVFALRTFVIGDAAGYLEPFTGEGIASSLAAAKMILPLVIESVADWRPRLGEQWQSMHTKVSSRNRLSCKIATRILRYPGLTYLAGSFLQKFPETWSPLAAMANKPYYEVV